MVGNKLKHSFIPKKEVTTSTNSRYAQILMENNRTYPYNPLDIHEDVGIPQRRERVEEVLSVERETTIIPFRESGISQREVEEIVRQGLVNELSYRLLDENLVDIETELTDFGDTQITRMKLRILK